MEQSEGKYRTYWNPLTWRWTLSLEERQYLRGIGDVTYGRKIGFVLAVGTSATCAALALVSLPRGFVIAVDPRLELAAAGLIFTLGILVRQGKAWASLALMAVFTAYLGITNLAAWRMPGLHYGEHPVFLTCRAIVCAAGWTMWMRVFWVAYRLERRTEIPTLAGQ